MKGRRTRNPLASGLAVVASAVIASGVYRASVAYDCRTFDRGDCATHPWAFTLLWIAGVLAEVALLGGAGALALSGIFVGAGIGAILAGSVGSPEGTDGELVGFGAMLVAGPFAMLLLFVALNALLDLALRRRTEHLARDGVRGTATVLSVLDRGTIGDLAQVRLRLRLDVPGGVRAPVEVERSDAVERLAVPRPGDTFDVLVDASDPTAWMYAPGDGPGTKTRVRNLVDVARHAGRRPLPPPARTATDVVAELRRLKDLHARGDLSAEEYAARSDALLPPETP